MLKKLLFSFLLSICAFGVAEAREYKQAVGTGTVTNAAPDAVVISSPGAASYLYLTDVYIFVSTAAAGGGGIVALEDGVGGFKIVTMDADALGSQYIHFDPPGYPLTADTLLNLTVEGAVTTQATAGATVRCNVVK